ncbi:flagellar basal body rod protein FlgC [Oceanobacillus locisalsi]|uniref:Flagellar basal-body rod protein FlgC n=1 Tax=Oceanobacillus locisalsi TaxID=546107 RepID=A0ABW3NJR2_9BACI
MSIFQSMNSSASGLTSQRLRMNLVSSNLANAQTTRATQNADGEFEPYRRKMATFGTDQPSFKQMLKYAEGNNASGGGVQTTSIAEDQKPFEQVYNPEHPDANEEGYVEMPNVDPLKEMVDLMGASRSYEANVTAFNASKGMLTKTLELGQ